MGRIRDTFWEVSYYRWEGWDLDVPWYIPLLNKLIPNWLLCRLTGQRWK